MRWLGLSFALLASPAIAQMTAFTAAAKCGMLICPQTAADSVCYDSTNGLITFEGATANAFETSLAVEDPTADTTITFPTWSIDFDCVAGSGNVCLGAVSGRDLVAGANQNSLFGVSSGVGLDNAACDANSFFGFQSGMLAHTSATLNSCFGFRACEGPLTGGNIVALGANTDVGAADHSDATLVGTSMVSKNGHSMLLGYGGHEQYFSQGTPKTLVDATATAFVRFGGLTAGLCGGATIHWFIHVHETGDTDVQIRSGTTTVAMLNEAGTEACGTIDDHSVVVVSGGGTLSASTSCASNAADTVDILMDANTNYAATDLFGLFYTVILDGEHLTVTPQ